MKNETNQLPIGVFDSGVGGLTVLGALREKLPHESFLYLGDTARLPYGTKSKETIIAYTKQAVQILVDRGIKLLVVACNTAATSSLVALKDIFPELPIISVLEPGAKAACAISRNGHIAIIATEATVQSQGYQTAIQKLRPEASVIAHSCGLFVSLAEEGFVDGEIVEKIATWYLKPLLQEQKNFTPDCLVLGCTHFPVLLPAIKKVVGDHIEIINSAQTTATHVAEYLAKLKLENPEQIPKEITFLVTDAPLRFSKIAIRFLDLPIALESIELVDVFPR